MDNKELEKVKNQAVEALTPAIDKKITAQVATKLPEIQKAVDDSLWDKVIGKIGQLMNVPKAIVEKLQSIDNLVADNEKKIQDFITNTEKLVNVVKDQVKGIEPYQMIVISEKDLRKSRTRSVLSWIPVIFGLGLAIGLLL